MPYTRIRSTSRTLTMALQYLLVRTHTARGYSLLGREADDDTLLHPGDEVAVGSRIPPARVRYSSYDPVRDVQQVSFGEITLDGGAEAGRLLSDAGWRRLIPSGTS